ncbi:hypothetical protein PCANC_13620 [Puccinia coronata f. sp. avenae]|uniref:Uncharacterized protein n=1 Tax=Puccinia coronata f. sp. avenae TaxID=200324 RepID=A0A2N5RX88_9BASI|nr:hypothetical protein PCANC_27811 [Puccinia coronata f. sp. avenae]PLW38203.1 hypothetical protein PCANC_13620 [Puccinia coronata f. sp. avenae]
MYASGEILSYFTIVALAAHGCQYISKAFQFLDSGPIMLCRHGSYRPGVLVYLACRVLMKVSARTTPSHDRRVILSKGLGWDSFFELIKPAGQAGCSVKVFVT